MSVRALYSHRFILHQNCNVSATYLGVVDYGIMNQDDSDINGNMLVLEGIPEGLSDASHELVPT